MIQAGKFSAREGRTSLVGLMYVTVAGTVLPRYVQQGEIYIGADLIDKM